MDTSKRNAIGIVDAYLFALQSRDLAQAKSFLDSKVNFVFPGERNFASIEEVFRNSRSRYQKVEKTIDRRFSWDENGVIFVLFTGYLKGTFVNGREFSGVRFADLFTLKDNRIIEQHVWNDIGELLLSDTEKSDAL